MTSRLLARLTRARTLRVAVLTVLFGCGLLGSFVLTSAGAFRASGSAVAASTAASTLSITAKDEYFVPKTLTADAGQITVTVTNAGREAHTFTIGNLLNLILKAGETKTATFTAAAGTYKYFCAYHGGMNGTLTVQAPTTTPPPTTPPPTSPPPTTPPPTTPPPPPTTPPPSGPGLNVTAKDEFFVPTTLTADAGEITVTVANAGRESHTFTIGNLVNLILKAGETKTATFSAAAGTYKYFCAFHGGMNGTLTVRPSSGSPPPPPPTNPPPPPPPSTGSTVTATDFAFTPSSLSAPAGAISFTVKNAGQLPHTFTIDGLVDLQLQPGETKTASFQAAAGTYRIYCAMPGHAGAGMTGTLVVGGAGAPPPPPPAPPPPPPPPPPSVGGSLSVNAADLYFSPSSLSVPAGPITLTVTNAGRIPHTFTIDGLVDLALTPGQTKTATFIASNGSYRIYCKEPGHAGAGMTGVLNVGGNAPPSGSGGGGGGGGGSAAGPPPPPSGPPVSSSTLSLETGDLWFAPARLAAPAGQVTVSVHNVGALPHTFTINGVVDVHVAPGETKSATFTVSPGNYDFYCGEPGHSAAGMNGALTVGPGTGGSAGPPAAGSAPSGQPSAEHEHADAGAPHVAKGTVTVSLRMEQHPMDLGLADPVLMWAFDQAEKAPVVTRVRQGATVRIKLENAGPTPQTMDFRSLGRGKVTVEAGKTATVDYHATRPGFAVYRSTNAERTDLVGGVVVEPARGWRTGRATREYVLLQSEFAAHGGAAPDLLVFNGYPDQYLDEPLAVKPKQRVRVFVLNAGLGPATFAVAGGRDARAWSRGKVLRRVVQLKTLPGSGAALEFETRPGTAVYPFHGWSTTNARLHATGMFRTEAAPAGPPPAAGGLRITLKDVFFEPKTLAAKAGKTTLTVKNAGKLPHTFTIDGLTNVRLTAGQSKTVTLDLKPGTYTYYCAEPGHRQAGMVGMLKVS